ncbi:unnamed protein product, partial [Ectocarpus sp. 12 AP-2014]
PGSPEQRGCCCCLFWVLAASLLLLLLLPLLDLASSRRRRLLPAKNPDLSASGGSIMAPYAPGWENMAPSSAVDAAEVAAAGAGSRLSSFFFFLLRLHIMAEPTCSCRSARVCLFLSLAWILVLPSRSTGTYHATKGAQVA